MQLNAIREFRFGPLPETGTGWWPFARGIPGDNLPESTGGKEKRVGIKTTLVVLSGLTIAIAILTLVGWAVPITSITGHRLMAMNPMIACGLFAASASLLLLRRNHRVKFRSWTGYALAGAVLSVGGLKLLSTWFGWNIDIDRWLFANEVAARPDPANLFSPKTALAFVLVGVVLLLLRNARAGRVAGVLSFLVAAIGVVNLQGTTFGIDVAPGFVPMSDSAGLGFTLLGMAALLARAERGAMSIIASNTAGGLLARRLLPVAVILPIVLGGLRLAGENAGWYDTALGVALFSTAVIFLFLAIIWGTARVLYRLDLKRQAAELAIQASEERVRGLNRELEQRVTERTSALEAATLANQDLEAFSYSVSHDLRAPLRAITGFSKIVSEEHSAGLPDEAQDYLRQVHSSALQMGHLIDDLLRFSRMGRQPLHLQPINVREVVNACLAELGAEKSRVEIQLEDLPACNADPPLLKQLWMNLLSNALKYSRKSNPAVVTIGSRRDGVADIYFVRDNGAGFDMKYAGKLFGVFQRLHLAEEYDGTGVGLALVQRIVHRHGGRVWAEGEVNRGATFSFTLQGGSDV